MASRLRLSGFEQTSESSQGGRHANIPVYTTFPRQNHGRLKRIRPAGDSRLTARDCDSSRDEELVVAPADWAAAIRQLGPELDRATQAGVLPGRPGPEPADRLRPLRLETCMAFDIYRNKDKKKLELQYRLRKCLFLYHYWIDDQFGWRSARIQSWLPFPIPICLNGREWLSRMMDRNGMSYRRDDNCFPWIDDFPKAQKLMKRQLRISWHKALARLARQLNPAHSRMFRGFWARYYWSVFQSEWATDVTFRKPSDIAAIYPALVLHGIQTFSSGDVMRFLGRKVHGNFEGEITSDFKDRSEGIRIKHCVKTNSIKAYNKGGNGLRIETTMNDPGDFKVFRPKQGQPDGKLQWLPLRLGVADIYRRAQVCQASNDRYLDALASVDTSTPLGKLIRDICRPTTYKGKRVRALRPWAELDLALFRAINRGEFCVNGFRNRDLQSLISDRAPDSPEEKRRRSARTSRLLRMLRAHHLIQKVPKTHRYLLTSRGRDVISAILCAQQITLEQLNKLAA